MSAREDGLAGAGRTGPGPGASSQREVRVKRSLSNPIYFAEVFFSPYDPRWTTLLPEFAHDMLRFVVSAKPWPLSAGIVMLPPEFLKPLDVDTLVTMDTGERRRLGDVQVGDRVITHRGRAARVEAIAEQGALDCLSIATYAGRTVVAAPDHPFLTPEGWRPASDLSVGSTLAITAADTSLAATFVAPQEARLAGYFIGDGSVSSGNANITCYDDEQGADVLNCAASLGFTVTRRPNNGSGPRGRDNLASYRFKGGVRPWLAARGMKGHTSRTKRVPAFVMRADKTAVAHFIGAYFACDGTVHKRSADRQDGQIIFGSVNRDLLCDVRHLLSRFGIRSAVKPHRAKDYLSWSLRVLSQDDLARFVAEIPVPGIKAGRLREMGVQRQRFTAEWEPDQIVAIEPAGMVECRCLAVSRDSSFLADDLAVHNTTLISQVYPLWLTVRARVLNKMLRGLLFSEQEDMAKGNLAVLKWHIVNNERLASDFVDASGRALLIPDPDMQEWSETSIIVHRPGLVSRDPTWQAKGLDSTGIQGRRLDVVIADDIVTPMNAASLAKRKAALEKLELVIEPRVFEGGQIIIAGNFNDAKDLLSMKARDARYHLFKRPTVHQPGKPGLAPAEKDLENPELSIPTWPANWSLRRFLIEWKAKPHRARRIHLLDPRADQGDRLQTGWVTLVREEEGAALLKYARMFIGVDPAPGGDSTEDLDFLNISVVALTLHHADLVQSFSVRASTPRQVDLLGRIHDSYNRVGYGVIAIGGAKIAMDRYFRGSVEIKRADLKHKLVEISIPEAEAAKEVRLEGLGPKAQSGWFRVWEAAWDARTSDAGDQGEELTLAEEWREFPYGNHDDRLDGADIALRTAEEFAMIGDATFALTVAGE